MTKKIQELSIIEQNILSNIQSGNGLQNALAPLVKRVIEAALQGEVEDYLEKDNLSKRNCDSFKNYRNGTSSKLVKSSVGEFELETPRDRNSNF